MSCTKLLAQLLLVIINIIFVLFGLSMFIVGAILRWSDGAFRDQIDPILKGLEKTIEDAGQGSIDADSFDLAEMLGGITIILLVMGAVIFFIAFLGCCGACCKVRIFLMLYGILMLVIFLTEVILIIIYFANRDLFVEKIKQPIVDHFQNEYAGFNATDVVSIGWNFAMLELSCCCVNDYKDFKETKKWMKKGKNKYYDSNTNVSVDLQTTIACCKMEGTFPESTTVKRYDCAWVLNKEYSNFERGCYVAIEELIAANKAGVIIGSVLYGLLQMLLFLSAFYLYSLYGKEKQVAAIA